MPILHWLRVLTVADLLFLVSILGADEPLKAPKETYRGKDKDWGERFWAA